MLVRKVMDDALLWWLAAASIVVFIATLIVVPWLVMQLPADYFAHRRRRSASVGEYPLHHLLLLTVKNVAGVLFLAMGIAMLVLPGQGLLTILVGLSLTDFPGKYQLERYIVNRKIVFDSLNWLRRRGGKSPFHLNVSTDASQSVRDAE